MEARKTNPGCSPLPSMDPTRVLKPHAKWHLAGGKGERASSTPPILFPSPSDPGVDGRTEPGPTDLGRTLTLPLSAPGWDSSPSGSTPTTAPAVGPRHGRYRRTAPSRSSGSIPCDP
ncbi:unnamed protein product, partial [Darwinula stevensoni]